MKKQLEKKLFNIFITKGINCNEIKEIQEKEQLDLYKIKNKIKNYCTYDATNEEKIKYNNMVKLEMNSFDLDTLQYMYEVVMKSNFNTTLIKTEAQKYGISYNTFVENAKSYALYYLGLTELEYQKKVEESKLIKPKTKINIQQKKFFNTFNNIINQIIEANGNKEKIYEIINNYPQKSEIKNKLYSYCKIRSIITGEDVDKLFNQGKNLLKPYFEVQEQKRIQKRKETIETKKQETKERYKNIIFGYCKSDLILTEYLRSIKMSKKYFTAVTRNIDENLYDYYKKVHARKKELYFLKIGKKLLTLIYFIKNGVKDNNESKHEFDVIDYYIYIGLDIDIIYKNLKYIKNLINFNPDDLKLLYNFLIHNFFKTPYGYADLHPNNIMFQGKINETFKFNVKSNKENKIIDEGITIDKEIDEKIISFMRQYNIPLDTYNYQCAIKKYLNHQLDNYIIDSNYQKIR